MYLKKDAIPTLLVVVHADNMKFIPFKSTENIVPSTSEEEMLTIPSTEKEEILAIPSASKEEMRLNNSAKDSSDT
ncbi:hypothetical protein Trydic_g18727 [Trypoxylus dichotomus]